VKWKGYTSDDNSWVSVEDWWVLKITPHSTHKLIPLISNAEDLINDFWEHHPEQRPKPRGSKQATSSKGGKGKLPSVEIASSSKSKSHSRYEDAMEVDSDHPPKRKSEITKVSKTAFLGTRKSAKPFSKLGREGTEEADDRTLIQPPFAPDGPSSKVQRLDLMGISDLKTKVESVDTVEMNHGKLFYFITL
jgi:hypothetical protein